MTQQIYSGSEKERRRQATAAYYHKNKTQVAGKARENYASGRNVEERLAASKRWRLKNPARQLFTSRKSQAKLKGIPFNLTFEEFLEMLSPMKCSVTGKSLEFKEDKHYPWKPSIDQVEPGKGYTPENTRVVCWIFNRAKHIGSDQEVLEMAEALVEFNNG